MRPGSRVRGLMTAVLGAAVAAIAVGAAPLATTSTHAVTRWQGPFEYVRDYGGSARGCAYHGRETLHATLSCSGADLMHLQCTATGNASHSYHEELDRNSPVSARNDSGEYQGALKADYDTQTIKGVDLFRLDVSANLPVQYRRTADAHTNKAGSYLLDVGGTTGDLVFAPQNPRLERRRVEPIYEPGPAACGVSGRFNGTETVSVQLLPVQ